VPVFPLRLSGIAPEARPVRRVVEARRREVGRSRSALAEPEDDLARIGGPEHVDAVRGDVDDEPADAAADRPARGKREVREMPLVGLERVELSADEEYASVEDECAVRNVLREELRLDRCSSEDRPAQ